MIVSGYLYFEPFMIVNLVIITLFNFIVFLIHSFGGASCGQFR